LNQLDVAVETLNRIYYKVGVNEYNEEICFYLCDALILNKFEFFKKFSIFGSELKSLLNFIMDDYNEKFKSFYNQCIDIYKVIFIIILY